MDAFKIDLPTADAWNQGCCWIGFSEEVTHAICLAGERLAKTPALLERFSQDRAALLRDKQPPSPHELEPLLPALVYLSTLPEVQQRDADRGIPESITQETLRDLEIWIRHHHEQHSQWGLSQITWPLNYFSGKLYSMGRLQFEMTRFPENCFFEGPEAPPVAADAPVLSVHIPASGKLDDSECGTSFERALEFFPRFFPEHRFEAFVCISWMMNRQLAVSLPESSNLVRFLQRFQPMGLKGATDAQAWSRVFGGPVTDFASAPRDTGLRRALLSHAEAGGQWLSAAGYIKREFPAP